MADAHSAASANKPPPKGLAKRLGVHYHGWNVAGADAFDMGMRQRHGDRTYTVEGALTGLDEFATVAAHARIRELGFGEDYPITHGALPMLAICERVGSGYGALLLATRKFARVLEIAPASASLYIAARRSE